MLRTTLVKIKRVCSLGNFARGLRSESCCGKFEKLAYTQIRAKSSYDDGKHRRTIFEFGFKPNRTPRKSRIDTFENISGSEEMPKQSIPKFANIMDKSPADVRNEAHCKMCELIIAKIFGKNEKDTRDELVENSGNISTSEEIRPKTSALNYPVYKSDKETGKIASESNKTDGWYNFPANILEKIAQVSIINDKNKLVHKPKLKTSVIYKDNQKSSINIDKTLGVMNTTTDKHIDDKFTQKVERVDEPSLVGDPEMKVEGFNVSPKKLQDNRQTLDFTGDPEQSLTNPSSEKHKQLELDDLANRCANFPDNELDERLLKEMDKLKFSQTQWRSGKGATDTNFKSVNLDLNRDLVDQKPMNQNSTEQNSLVQNMIDVSNQKKKQISAISNVTDKKNECVNIGIRRDLVNQKAVNQNLMEQRSLVQNIIHFFDHKKENISANSNVTDKNMENVNLEIKMDLVDRKNKDQNPVAQLSTVQNIIDVLNQKKEKTSANYNVPDENFESIKLEIKTDLLDQKSMNQNLMGQHSLEQNITDVPNPELEKTYIKDNVMDKLYPTYDGLLSEQDDFKSTYTNDGMLSEKDDCKSSLKFERLQLNDKPLLKNDELTHTQQMDIVKIERPKLDPSLVLIDPYDKKNLAHENYEHCDVLETEKPPLVKEEVKVENSKDGNEMKTNLHDKSQFEFIEKVFDYEQLNPSYVVTCNETCPISTNGLTGIKDDESCIEGTEVIYDEKFIRPIIGKIKVQTTDQNHKLRDPQTDLDSDENTTKKSGKSSSNLRTCSDKNELDEITFNHIKPEPVSNLFPHVPVTNFVQSGQVNNLGPTKAKSESEKMVASDLETETIDAQSNVTVPKLNDGAAPLSELLKRVRERNRQEYCSSMQLSQATVVAPSMGKCGAPSPCPPPPPKCPPAAPKCPPPAPKCPPPAPKCPSPCPPAPPPCPKPCRPCPPPKKDPCDPCKKFHDCRDSHKGSFITIFMKPSINYHRFLLPISIYNLNYRECLDDLTVSQLSVGTVVTEEFMLKVQTFGTFLFNSFGKCQFQKTSLRERFVKDFNPWTPIPSWPIPEKVVKRPLVCPKEGCKIYPPPKLNSPCRPDQNPCTSFPKRTCSVADYVIFVFGERRT